MFRGWCKQGKKILKSVRQEKVMSEYEKYTEVSLRNMCTGSCGINVKLHVILYECIGRYAWVHS